LSQCSIKCPLWSLRRHETTTTMPDPGSEGVPPRGGEGLLRLQAFRRGEHLGRVGFDPRSFFPRDGRSSVSHPTSDVPFPPRRTGICRQIPERDDLGPPVVPGGQEIGLGSRNLRLRAEAHPAGRRPKGAAMPWVGC
jgi:hypothetical protein